MFIRHRHGLALGGKTGDGEFRQSTVSVDVRRKFGGALAEGWEGVGNTPFDLAQGRLFRKEREKWGTRLAECLFGFNISMVLSGPV
jgi:hypothetical protein